MQKHIQNFSIQRTLRALDSEQNKTPQDYPLWMQHVLSARGANSNRPLKLSELLLPDNLKGIRTAVELLKTALTGQWKIAILGDFDTDGATACALVHRALLKFGYQHVDFFVPNRFRHGYGLSAYLIDDLLLEGDYRLIITVDNGINAVEGVEYAKKKGIATLITDHHLPGEIVPNAAALVNPNQTGCSFGSKNLAGVGVAFYVMAALKKALKSTMDMREFLPLVAVGTVADMVPLDFNNRILVHHGLCWFRKNVNSYPGILALCQLSKINAELLNERNVGFMVAPRLNAAGRLSDMSIGIRCLMADNKNTALKCARELCAYNEKRKKKQAQMMSFSKDYDVKNDAIVCLYDSSFHEGVVGIVAGKMKDKYHKPSICFAKNEQGILKASARSVAGLHIRDFLEAFNNRFPHHLGGFGGHAMAAGLTLKHVDFELFKTDLCSFYNEFSRDKVISMVRWSDGCLELEDLSLKSASLIESHAPWGVGFEQPIFEGRFYLHGYRLLTPNMVRLVFQENNEQQALVGIYFSDDLQHLETGFWYDVLYELEKNTFNQRSSFQLRIIQIAVYNGD